MNLYLPKIKFDLLTLYTVFLALIVSGCATSDSNLSFDNSADLNTNQTGPGPYSFECDARSGHFNVSKIQVSTEKTHVTGTLQISEIRRHRNWAAFASIHFGVFNKPPYMGLQVTVMPNKPDSFQFALTGRGNENDRIVFGSIDVTDAPMPFELTLNRNGNLTVSISGRSKSLSLNVVEPTELSLTCSTAFVHFSNVIIN